MQCRKRKARWWARQTIEGHRQNETCCVPAFGSQDEARAIRGCRKGRAGLVDEGKGRDWPAGNSGSSQRLASENASRPGVDILWVGALYRQPILRAGGGRCAQGWISRAGQKPRQPTDLELWIGALEELNRAGIKKLAAIHRGFSSLTKSPFRECAHGTSP